MTPFSRSSGLTPESVITVISAVAQEFDIVGLSITEYIPPGAQLLGSMMQQLPLLGGQSDI